MFGHTERLTRRELYDLVWSTPMMKLADRFELSGNGLAKLCVHHNIPVPERGYWQRKESGVTGGPSNLSIRESWSVGRNVSIPCSAYARTASSECRTQSLHGLPEAR